MNVSTFGWILESASARTMSLMTLLPGHTNCSRERHSNSTPVLTERLVDRCQFENLQFACSAWNRELHLVPTCLPRRPRPIGELVEINPLVTSDSSLVTNL